MESELHTHTLTCNEICKTHLKTVNPTLNKNQETKSDGKESTITSEIVIHAECCRETGSSK